MRELGIGIRVEKISGNKNAMLLGSISLDIHLAWPHVKPLLCATLLRRHSDPPRENFRRNSACRQSSAGFCSACYTALRSDKGVVKLLTGAKRSRCSLFHHSMDVFFYRRSWNTRKSSVHVPWRKPPRLNSFPPIWCLMRTQALPALLDSSHSCMNYFLSSMSFPFFSFSFLYSHQASCARVSVSGHVM